MGGSRGTVPCPPYHERPVLEALWSQYGAAAPLPLCTAEGIRVALFPSLIMAELPCARVAHALVRRDCCGSRCCCAPRQVWGDGRGVSLASHASLDVASAAHRLRTTTYKLYVQLELCVRLRTPTYNVYVGPGPAEKRVWRRNPGSHGGLSKKLACQRPS